MIWYTYVRSIVENLLLTYTKYAYVFDAETQELVNTYSYKDFTAAFVKSCVKYVNLKGSHIGGHKCTYSQQCVAYC